jgi:hypothetical protein
MRWAASVLAFVLVGAALALALGCGSPSSSPWFQPEPWISLERLPSSGNLVAFGSSVASVERRAEAVRYLDGVVRGRLPGVRLEVYRWPVALPPGAVGSGPNGFVSAGPVTSYRSPGGPIVLSWWTPAERPELAPVLSGWSVGDAPWEVSHYVDGTDDDGRPIAGGLR